MEGGQARASLIVAISVTMCGFIGLCSRNLSGFGFGPEETSLVRSVVTVVGLVVIMVFMDRKDVRVRPRDIVIFLLFGAFKLLSDVTFFSAQDKISLGLTTLLQMTAPFYVLALSYFMFKEEITYRKIVAMFCAFFGLMLVCDIFADFNSKSYFGIMCGIASGFFFALYTIGSKIFIDKAYNPLTVVLYTFIFSLVLNLPLADLGTVASAFTIPESLGYILVLGLFFTLVPFVVDVWAIRILPPSTVALIGVLEAVGAALVGWVFFGEVLSPVNMAGMAIVILSVVLLNIKLSRSYVKTE